MPNDAQPLAGLTVVEFSTSVAAPFAGQILADLGARVLKIENPDGGDDARRWGPPFAANGMSAVFNALNRNKRSVTVDLKDPVALGRLKRFISRRADIVLQNMRPGLIRDLGLDPADLRRNAPGLIWCDLAAFGATGPKRMQPGYDPLMQACAGIMSVTGHPGQDPVRVGPSLVDQGAGMWAVIGILSALRERDRTGRGADVGTSLYETALGWLPAQFASYFLTGRTPGKLGSENFGIAPYKAFEAEDGWLVIAAGNDRLFRRLTDILGDADLAADPRFASNPDRVANRLALNAWLERLVRTGRRDDWIERCAAAGIPCAPVLTLDEVAADPQFDAVGMDQTAPGDDLRLLGIPLTFDGTRPPLRHAAPDLGDNADILGEDQP